MTRAPYGKRGQGRCYSDRPTREIGSARCVSHCPPAPEGHVKGALKSADITAPPVVQMEILQQIDNHVHEKRTKRSKESKEK